MSNGEAVRSEAIPRGPDPSSSERRWHWPGAASTPSSATNPADYAILEAIFLAGLTGVVALAHRRDRDGAPSIPRDELPVLAMATFTLADVIAKERVSTWLREPFVHEGGDHKPMEPEGSGLQRAVGELLTCTRCVGTWSALGIVGLRTASPPVGRAASTVLALAGVNDLLQSGFRLLAERTNRAARETEAARRAASDA
ncbi:MAG: DUF1360 domain-containing protein [Actinomycetota bacterium]|nr:DUF1360 domain-containing protein [Actinomycetota bacterium]